MLTLPNETQLDILSSCDQSTLRTVLVVSRHMHIQAVRVLYARPVVIRSWTALIHLFSLPPASAFDTPSLALDQANARRAELDLIRVLVLDFPGRFMPRPPPPPPPGPRRHRMILGAGPVKSAPALPKFGPAKLLGLRTRPLLLDTLLVSHGEPLGPLASLLQGVNPVRFGCFAFDHYLDLYEDFDWQFYASFAGKTWSRLEEWSFQPVQRYSNHNLHFDDRFASSPFKAAGAIKRATLYLCREIAHNQEAVLRAFQAFCPRVEGGRGVEVVAREDDCRALRALRSRVVAGAADGRVKEWWQSLEFVVGKGITAHLGVTLWPRGVLPT